MQTVKQAYVTHLEEVLSGDLIVLDPCYTKSLHEQRTRDLVFKLRNSHLMYVSMIYYEDDDHNPADLYNPTGIAGIALHRNARFVFSPSIRVRHLCAIGVDAGMVMVAPIDKLDTFDFERYIEDRKKPVGMFMTNTARGDGLFEVMRIKNGYLVDLGGLPTIGNVQGGWVK